MAIGGAAAAAALVAVLVLYQGASPDSEPTGAVGPEPQDTSSNTGQMVVGPELQEGDAERYLINTECELIYGFTYGVYPNDEAIPGIKIAELLAKYPDEFAQWKQIMDDPVQREAFFNQPIEADFGNVLVTAMMKETSVNPDLREIALLLTDPNGRAKLAEDFAKYDCQNYFDSRAASKTVTP